MHSMLRVVAIGLLLFFVSSAPAAAQWRWLEHMSGPGWYDGVTIEQKVWCLYPPPPLPTVPLPRGATAAAIDAAIKQINETNDRILLLGWQRQEDPADKSREKIRTALAQRLSALPAVSLPCRFGNMKAADIKQLRRHTFGYSGSLLWSTINRLDYDPSVRKEDTQVWIAAPGVFYDWRPFGNVEIGGSLERFVFFGAAMKPLGRWASEARATLNLGTVSDADTGNPIAHLKLRIGVMKLNKLVVPADFGALGGPEPDEPEWLTSARVVIDFECLPWRSRAC